MQATFSNRVTIFLAGAAVLSFAAFVYSQTAPVPAKRYEIAMCSDTMQIVHDQARKIITADMAKRAACEYVLNQPGAGEPVLYLGRDDSGAHLIVMKKAP